MMPKLCCLLLALSIVGCGEYDTAGNAAAAEDEKVVPTTQKLNIGNCNDDEVNQLNAMTDDAWRLSSVANVVWDMPNYANAYAATKTWFGSNGSPQVSDTLININNQMRDSTFQFYCDGDDASDPSWNPACGTENGYYARQEYFAGAPTVLICPVFWSQSNADQAVTILHELSHFAGTNDADEGKGRQGALDMAINDPDAAATSAYNYQFFYSDVQAAEGL
jgi:hypothetical protein